MHKKNSFRLILAVILGLILALFIANQTSGFMEKPVKEIGYNQFEDLLKEDKIVHTTNSPLCFVVGAGGSQEIKGKAYISDSKPEDFSTSVYTPLMGQALQAELSTHHIVPKILHEKSFNLMPTLELIVPLLILLVLLRTINGTGKFDFKKNHKVPDTKFADVAGVDESKSELQEIVEFLKDPHRYSALGARIPRGVLMVGAPGTGKTLLARAVAGEAGVDFFTVSGSDFIEKFVGMGANRVRAIFKHARSCAPCIIFIDEIDAVGGKRSSGGDGPASREYEQTLNQLLVEMDGFANDSGIIVIAATNRPDILDDALLRPGRFDRQVVVPLPDVKGREEILKVHAKKVKVADSVDFSIIARGTPGYSGAELANVINEAALLAASRSIPGITQAELEESRDRVKWGKERRSLAMSDREKTITAWHEAGHALLNVALPHTHPLHKVTIIPRGLYLGATMYLPSEESRLTSKKEAMSALTLLMGGRIAEKMFTDDFSNGIAGDIAAATNLAEKMVKEWGMSPLGMREFAGRPLSNEIAASVDDAVSNLLKEAYNLAEDVLEKNKETVRLIAELLLEKETVDGSEIVEIWNKSIHQ